jgi:hypothetical protein
MALKNGDVKILSLSAITLSYLFPPPSSTHSHRERDRGRGKEQGIVGDLGSLLIKKFHLLLAFRTKRGTG